MKILVDSELLTELRDAANEAANLAIRQYRIDHFKFLVAGADELLAQPAPADTRLVEADAARYRWLIANATYGIDYRQRPELTLPIYAPDNRNGLDAAIDAALAAHKGEPT